jgi:hypothetical protein
MATSGQSIWTPIGRDPNKNGYVRDYRHAARIFRSNDFSRAPKAKYSFYVRFITNPNAENSYGVVTDPLAPNELNYLVKNIELPKFDIEVQDLNQYNRKVLVQRQIKYSPITIKFHDDNIGALRRFWQNYYMFYYNDGRYVDAKYKIDDKYLSRSTSGSSNRWGYDTGVKVNYIDKIEIYSMYHTNRTQLITLENPIISSFNHDSHDYSEGQGLMEATMTLHYTGVIYDTTYKNARGRDIPGFGQSSSETYDTSMSPLTLGNPPDTNIDPKTGEKYTGTVTNDIMKAASEQYIYTAETHAQAFKQNPSNSAIVSNSQIATMGNSTNINQNNVSKTVFPTTTSSQPASTTYGAVNNINYNGTLANSNGESVYTPSQLGSLYQPNTWQYNLYLKGYTPTQISAADQYIFSQGTGAFGAGIPGQAGPNYQQIAEQFILNPVAVNYNYQQQSNIPTSINFTDPNASTQAIYNGESWQTVLSGKGYAQGDILLAQNYINSIKLSATADIASIAESYIIKSKLITTNTLV